MQNSQTVNLQHRYLTRFEPKRIPHTFVDLLIVGGGIAGIRAAMVTDPNLHVMVLTKDELRQSNSSYAQGGIAGVFDPKDDIAFHVEDTLKAGKGICDEEVVKMVVGEAPERIRELVSFGTDFDRKDGELALTQEGGHRHRRVAHALGDATGEEIMRAMILKVRDLSWIEIREKTFIIDLLTSDGVCRGALVWNENGGRMFVWAKQTIIATGGAGQLYRETTNPEIATADGHAIAFRAGAEVQDMEFVQFHPTVLYIAGGSRHLITEAVRGEGAYLRDTRGERFMQEYDPAGELAPRDVVSRAITDRMAKTRHSCVYLDLSHLDADLVGERFPHIGKMCAEFGLDIKTDLIPVRPGAHYMIGGIVVDADGRTSLPGLWAAGEATSSGLHGANRLGSNSLLEGLVFGLRAGSGASQAALAQADSFTALPLVSDWKEEIRDDEELNLTDLRNALTSLMWRQAGIRRDEEGLQSALEQVEFWDRYVSAREFDTPLGWELQNLLLAARLVISSAIKRSESRGVHFRSDFPETDEAQAMHFRFRAEHSSP